MNQDISSFQSAKSIIEYFASDKTRYPFWIIIGSLRTHGLDAMEAAGALLKSQDDDEVILALQVLDSYGDLCHKFLPELEGCLCHENLMVRLTAVDPVLNNDEIGRSTMEIFESWISNDDSDESIVKVVGAHAIATIDPKQTEPMSHLLSKMLSDLSVCAEALERLLQLNFQDESVVDVIADHLAKPEHLAAVFCNKRILDLLGSSDLITRGSTILHCQG